MDERVSYVLRGAVAGLVGTVTMSLAVAAGYASGKLEKPPPKEIVERTTSLVGVRHAMEQETIDAAWVAAHFGYGAAGGAIFALMQRVLPDWPLVNGLIYGGTVWMLSYVGLLPRLGL